MPPAVYEVLRSPGQALDAGILRFMEARLGHNFGEVRVHTCARASDSARAVDALAYTVGSHVVFGSGQYAPQATEGRRLLAHELAHVIQQNGRNPADGQRMEVAPTDDPAEREASAAADDVCKDLTAHSTSSDSVPRLCRAPEEGAAAPLEREPEGRPVTRTEWQEEIRPALVLARAMASETLRLLENTHVVLAPDSDPRLHTAEEAETARRFTTHFKSLRRGDAFDIREAFRTVAAALRNLDQGSFRRVPVEAVTAAGEPETLAFVRGRTPPVYLGDPFFLSAEGEQVGPRMAPGTRGKARILIHEVAHLTLGVQHAGGVFSHPTTSCASGHPLSTFRQASNNAYAFDQFAFCFGGGAG